MGASGWKHLEKGNLGSNIWKRASERELWDGCGVVQGFSEMLHGMLTWSIFTKWHSLKSNVKDSCVGNSFLMVFEEATHQVRRRGASWDHKLGPKVAALTEVP